jgi:signal transduction histidine kinase/ligand-binding sensor domain-containing protein/CheY-like chemotaxis protein
MRAEGFLFELAMHTLRRFLTLALWGALAIPGPLAAQRYNFKFYGEEDGLQNLAVQVVLQDRAGFLWAGTQNGLFRYDGSRFMAFGKADGLPAGRIDSLHESVDGTLWVGTHLGLAMRAGSAIRQGERFEPVALGVARGVTGREALASDSAGHLYVATERGLAVGTKSPTGWAFRLVGSVPGHAVEEPVSAVYVDSTGTVWYGCGASTQALPAAGLCRLKNGQVSEAGEAEGLRADRWEAILEDLEGNIWVRSEHQLAERSPVTGRFQFRTESPHGSLQPATNTVPTLALDPDGSLLVPTNLGLARQTRSGWELIGAEQGLTTNDISAVQQDREGSIWIGLLGSGLARWLGYREWQGWSEREGLSRESVWAEARDSRGRLWVGTQFGLDYAEEKDGQLTWRHQPLSGGLEIRALAAAPDGTLWVGANRAGLRQFDPRTGAVSSFGPEQGLTNDSPLNLMVDRGGRIWAATRAGLFRSRLPAPGGVTRFERMLPPGSQTNEGFLMVFEDSHGRVWACGDNGLARYSDGEWTRYTVQDGLKDNMVGQVAEDLDGSLWVGYRDAFGLSHLTFNGGHPQFEHFNSTNVLKSDKTIFLGRDARGWLWVGTDHGVDVYDRTRWRHLGRSDGLIWDDTNLNGFLAEPGGSVWIGTSRGLSRFQPRATPIPVVPPPVVFTSVKLGGQEVDPRAANEVPYRQNSLQVQLAALTFLQESSVVFHYRLQSERNWTDTHERELNYLKLPPGQYVLEVMARNTQGVWSAEPARLRFEILTPWFLSWWFRLASVLLLLVLGHLLWKRRTYRLEMERHRLETAVTQRTRELSQEKQKVLEEKARAENENAVVQQQNKEIERLLAEARQASRFKSEFLANMSHEIRTPMNGILGMTDLVLTSDLTAEQREYLETARESADSLLRILNDVLDFSKIEAGKLDLNPIVFSLRKYVHQTVKIFAVNAAEKRLELGVRFSDETPDQLLGDPDRLQQVLLNLIGNAIKFTSRGGVMVMVEVEAREGWAANIHFAVHDTGIGIPLDKQQIIFESFRQADGSTTRKFGGTGLGLAISSKLVALMGGRIWVESEAERGSAFHFTSTFEVPRTEDRDVPVTDALAKSAPAKDGPAKEASGKADGLRRLLGSVTEDSSELHVLLAEDNVINQKLATKLLERRGHRVTAAGSGRQALEILARESFDVVLMDVQMPDMDGLEATQVIRARERGGGRRIPIAALTAHTMTGDRERCLAAGMDAFITKPIDAAQFITTVETMGKRLRPTSAVRPPTAPEPQPAYGPSSPASGG